ncbi:MAG: hypothetical protein FJ241_00925 [Nitrospira sp.]|nr:hypothetical protein [Nitrospira sp.]
MTIQKLILFIFIIIFLVIPYNFAFPENKNFQFKKQPEIQQVKPKKPVKIKLKRLSEGKYTWELTGDDVDEVVRTDKKLRKLLKIE